MRRLLGSVLIALAIPALTLAEAPDTVLRPVARPASQAAPAAPLRPMARPDAATGVINTPGTPPQSDPVPDTAPPQTPIPPAIPPVAQAGTDITLPQADASPVVARQAPSLALTLDTPRIDGPRQMVMAELLMTDPPAPPVFRDAWDGQSPPLRPTALAARTAPSQSPLLRPETRPETLPSVAPQIAAQLRPRPRPAAPADPQPMVPADPDTPPAYAPGAQPGLLPDGPGYSEYAVARAFRPPARPQNVSARAEQVRTEQVRGQVCGTPDIQGEVVSAIRDGGGCGIEEPVRIRSVSGVRLSTPALMDCTTAQALNRWVVSGAMPAVGSHGGGMTSLSVMGHYACRPRNNQAGQRLSEHGKGRAIDIGAIGLRNGTEISVLSGWNRQGDGAILRAMHRAACGTFGTVLGPDANRFHANHFHFDTASYRSGSYCR